MLHWAIGRTHITSFTLDNVASEEHDSEKGVRISWTSNDQLRTTTDLNSRYNRMYIAGKDTVKSQVSELGSEPIHNLTRHTKNFYCTPITQDASSMKYLSTCVKIDLRIIIACIVL